MGRVTNGLDRLSEPDFISMMNTINGKMLNNPYFPNQQAAVAVLKTETEGYMVLCEKAVGGSRSAILARDSKKATILVLAHNLGNEVTAVAQGDIAILESSGFPYTGAKKNTPDLVKPDAPKVSAGVNLAEILCVATRQVGNEGITFMISPDPTDENSWKSFPSKKAKYLFTNLVSGKRYYIKYALVGSRDQVVVSDIVTYIAQ